VLDDRHRVAGVVDASDVIRAYRSSLEETLRRLGASFAGSSLVELRVERGAEADGRTVSDRAWPTGTVVVAIQRGEQLIFPEPETRLAAGDVVSILAPTRQVDRLEFASSGRPSEPGERDDVEPMI
jgi:Trk K+ transport system NAD-binding subunit